MKKTLPFCFVFWYNSYVGLLLPKAGFRWGEGGGSVLVHLGQGVSVRSENIIILTDLQHEQSLHMETLIGQFRRRGLLRVMEGKPKTMVLCRERAKTVCYLSSVGLRTLRKRIEERQLIEMSEVQHG